MTYETTVAKVIKIVAHVLEKDEASLPAAVPFTELGADEFDLLQLTMKLEDEFKLLIDEQDMQKLLSIQAAATYIAARKTEK